MIQLLHTWPQSSRLLALALALGATSAPALADDPVLEWVRSEPYFGGAAVDSAGNVAVGGQGETYKYAPDGTLLWERPFSLGPGHLHLNWTAVDPDDNVIRSGYWESGNWAFVVIKYDPDGNLLWHQLAYYGYGPEARRVETDEQGGIYVFGETRPTIQPYHAFMTVKFSPSGDVLWTQIADSGNQPKSMDVREGQVVVAGAGYNRYVTVSYDYDGNELWRALYQGVVGAEDVAIGPDGQVAVCGWSGIPGTMINAGTVVQYDSAGNEQWVVHHNSPVGIDQFRKIDIGEDGSVVAVGQGLTAQADDAWSVLKLDTAGNVQWARLLDGVPWGQSSGFEQAHSVKIAPSGSIYVGGPSGRACGFGMEGHVAKYTAAGTLEWDHPLGDPSTCLSHRPERILLEPRTGSFFAYTHYDVYRLREPLGASYCPQPTPNSTGLPAHIQATGSSLASSGELVLVAADLPLGQFGYFLTSQIQGSTPGPAGSQGTLCLGGSIGRFQAHVASSGSVGELTLTVDLSSMPTNPMQAVAAGETWSFQAWHRDLNPTPTSNFSDAVAIQYQ